MCKQKSVKWGKKDGITYVEYQSGSPGTFDRLGRKRPICDHRLELEHNVVRYRSDDSGLGIPSIQLDMEFNLIDINNK
jgi:hypothetical protein